MNFGIGLVILIFFIVIDILAISAIISMCISLKKEGDERRNLIVQKASANTLIITLIYLMILSFIKMVTVFSNSSETFNINPIQILTTIAIIYLCFIHYYKKKYGD